MPVHNGSRHIIEVANLSLDLLNLALTFKLKQRPNEKLQLRIGRCIILYDSMYIGTVSVRKVSRLTLPSPLVKTPDIFYLQFTGKCGLWDFFCRVSERNIWNSHI